MSTAILNTASPSETAAGGRIRRAAHIMVLSWATDALVAAPQKLLAHWMERRRIARTVDQLHGLSDRMLMDIGLQRCDIERVARYGRDATDIRSTLS
jgi:uncharacterized protein YjiS (DUF1127 family)